jgi:hypothetical protein
MTEKEAAAKLGALLNEIEASGHVIRWTSYDGHEGLEVGDAHFIAEPPCEDEPWEVRPL